ncbi:MAG: o-succinylbenzoate--CoA ligase [Nocardioides sp.]
MRRTTGSWVSSFAAVTDLSGIGPGARVWVPGAPAGSMNVFARVHAAWAGAEVVSAAEGASHAVLTPASLADLLPSVRPGLTVVVAGDALAPATAERAVAAGLEVHHYYGAAELSFVAWGHDAATLHPFPGVEVDVRDGEVFVRSPYLAEGCADPDGWATVGDRGAWDGSRLVLRGRPDAVTTGGATVRIGEVEAVLRAHAHGEVVVLGVPHPTLGQVLGAVLTEPSDRGLLGAVARTELVAAARPRRWWRASALPLTEAGKVDRARLAEQVPSLPRLTGPTVGP